jgi:hypothetical protein
VVLCGGTAEYLRQELETHFAETPVTWNGGVELSNHIDDQDLGCRILDAYGLYLGFRGTVITQQTVQETETAVLRATTG